MQRNNKVVLLFSGGIDSTVLLYWLNAREYEIFPIIINYGQITYKSEKAHAMDILTNLDISNLYSIDIPEISKLGGGSLIGEYPIDVTSNSEWYKTEFFPNRNLILLTLASNYAYRINAYNLAIGLVGKSYKDTSLKFLNSFKHCVENSLKSFNIIAPYADKERKEVIRQAIELAVPLEKTFSCNSLSDRHCQLCNSCFEREIAFKMIKEICDNSKT